MLYVVTGVRGSGKTTLIESVNRRGLGLVLQPSTTRSPRFEGEDEYEFVTEWLSERYAWEIRVGGDHYGTRLSEVARSMDATAFTVFEPTQIHVFDSFRRHAKLPSLTVGLDTVRSSEEQRARVGASASRAMTEQDFLLGVERVRESDICLSGDATEVLARLEGLISP